MKFVGSNTTNNRAIAAKNNFVYLFYMEKILLVIY